MLCIVNKVLCSGQLVVVFAGKMCPLVDKLCKVNPHNMVEGSSSSCYLQFNFHLSVNINTNTNRLIIISTYRQFGSNCQYPQYL